MQVYLTPLLLILIGGFHVIALGMELAGCFVSDCGWHCDAAEHYRR
ncbi:hypothetical protein SPV1_08236 [Mariprofundus ferrooxydans PV-1]|uniref:Uncharacterized protein n=1 Tax=Mariprofundus ferrooxydans PV-1 TaxID=314345 RepID=Q0EX79_9PROT|nr:hypothetical protein SPV1_08236 [Mariprofundus ferrooxydans PV-1]